MNIVEHITDLFEKRGDSEYGGEAVTQQEHALQTALLAEQAGAEPELIVAALLHDVGHLLHDLPDDAPEEGIDDRHEVLGQRWLAKHFDPDVTEPVRMHVEAKRYLCAVESEYYDSLSPPSLQSLDLQGGPFTEGEVREFEQLPYFQDAVALRRWDDEAKVEGLETPDVAHFLKYAKSISTK